jgi:SOS-response transcriptional repressor LexA
MADLENLTPRQREIYNFIRSKIQRRGYGPTVREIGNEFEIKSPNGVMCHLKALQDKGLIHREPNMSQAMQLLDDPADLSDLPYSRQVLELSPEVLARFSDVLPEGGEIEDYDRALSDLLRKALALYRVALDAKKEGKAVGVVADPAALETEFVDL